MKTEQQNWMHARNALVDTVVKLGFPEALGKEVAKNLGSPKAVLRMTSYLNQVKPKKAELVVDEMLAIMEEIEAWRDKKECEHANARYNEVLNFGLQDNY